jgi:hypothetical protein
MPLAGQALLEEYDVILVPSTASVELRGQQQRWVWCCHIDLSGP